MHRKKIRKIIPSWLILFAAFLGAAFIMPGHAKAYEVQSLPGSTWVNINYSDRGIVGSGAMGWINQGIDWFTVTGVYKQIGDGRRQLLHKLWLAYIFVTFAKRSLAFINQAQE